MTSKLKLISSRARLSTRYLLGFVGMHSDDILLVSFPRSGNTWMRFLLCNLISLCEWNGKKVDFELLNREMPELGVNNLLAGWPHSTIPRVIKTHRPYMSLFRRNRSIGIIRDPRDVMVSFYHYTKDRKGIYTGTFAEFIRHPNFGLESWFEHYESWRDRWTLTIKYEDMKDDTFREFNRVLDLLGINYSEDIVRKVIDQSRIQSTREAEKSSLSSERREAVFARSGSSQQWTTYFDLQDLAYYYSLAEKFGVYLYTDADAKTN